MGVTKNQKRLSDFHFNNVDRVEGVMPNSFATMPFLLPESTASTTHFLLQGGLPMLLVPLVCHICRMRARPQLPRLCLFLFLACFATSVENRRQNGVPIRNQ